MNGSCECQHEDAPSIDGDETHVLLLQIPETGGSKATSQYKSAVTSFCEQTAQWKISLPQRDGLSTAAEKGVNEAQHWELMKCGWW